MPFLTETEAKKLWCPQTRVALVEGMAANRTGAKGAGLSPDSREYGNIYQETRCLASGCMLWEPCSAASRYRDDEVRGRCGLSTLVDLES